MPIATAQEWKVFLEGYPDAHLLQSAEWGILKENFKWKVIRVIVDDVGAQILLRQFFPGVTLAYIPKGPVGVSWDRTTTSNVSWMSLLQEIDSVCKKQGVFLLKLEPDTWESVVKTNNDSNAEIHTQVITPPDGFRKSLHGIQPMRTLVVDISLTEDRILSRMKQKTRYNIGLARRKNIVVHPGADISNFYDLMQQTGARDQFFVHDQDYYQMAHDLFYPAGYCELLQAVYEGDFIAGLMVFALGARSWYLYGASSNLHRERMPSYLLQWEAMQWAKQRGCREYDLWGVPDESLSNLEEQFTQRTDGLWGVYRFKRGFGGDLRRAAGPWDRVYNPLLYFFYSLWTRRLTPMI